MRKFRGFMGRGRSCDRSDIEPVIPFHEQPTQVGYTMPATYMTTAPTVHTLQPNQQPSAVATNYPTHVTVVGSGATPQVFGPTMQQPLYQLSPQTMLPAMTASGCQSSRCQEKNHQINYQHPFNVEQPKTVNGKKNKKKKKRSKSLGMKGRSVSPPSSSDSEDEYISQRNVPVMVQQANTEKKTKSWADTFKLKKGNKKKPEAEVPNLNIPFLYPSAVYPSPVYPDGYMSYNPANQVSFESPPVQSSYGYTAPTMHSQMSPYTSAMDLQQAMGNMYPMTKPYNLPPAVQQANTGYYHQQSGAPTSMMYPQNNFPAANNTADRIGWSAPVDGSCTMSPTYYPSSASAGHSLQQQANRYEMMHQSNGIHHNNNNMSYQTGSAAPISMQFPVMTTYATSNYPTSFNTGMMTT